MNGREKKSDNDLFFVCSMIEYIARRTKNTKTDIVSSLGKIKLANILELADVYHSENMDKLSDELIQEFKIQNGNYDNIANCNYSIPTHWDIGKVYKRLLLQIEKDSNSNMIDLIFEVFRSPISTKIDDLNSSMYYENPDYIYESYKLGKPCEY